MSRFRAALGQRDVLLLTLDALRWDTAQAAWPDTPNLRALVGAWSRCVTPGTFTLPAHEAFFGGFFPAPVGPHVRPFGIRMPGARSVGPGTLVFDSPDVISGYAAAGHHTICIGGVGFFDPQSPAGAALTARFAERHFRPDLGVRGRRASERAFRLAAERLAALPADRRALLFVNAAATHPPTTAFLPGATADSVETQRAALVDLDRHLPVLLDALRARGGAVGIVCADHGTCFGDDGLWGHRNPHPAVLTVPYAEFTLDP